MARAKSKPASVTGPRCRILSIDGGGIRGILPGQVLVMLERILKKETGKADARIAEYFDLIAGTSTGGILACILLAPDDTKKRPQFSASEAVDLYLERGDEVFDLSLWQRIKSGGGLLDEKYSADGLMEALERATGGYLLRNEDMKKRVDPSILSGLNKLLADVYGIVTKFLKFKELAGVVIPGLLSENAGE